MKRLVLTVLITISFVLQIPAAAMATQTEAVDDDRVFVAEEYNSNAPRRT